MTRSKSTGNKKELHGLQNSQEAMRKNDKDLKEVKGQKERI